MLKFGQGNFDDDIKDVVELCSRWWKDSLFYKTYSINYSVDENLFRTMWESGFLVYTCGRDEEGKLIACYVAVKQPYMFNPYVMSAHEIVWCIDKEHRNFKNLMALLKAIELLMEKYKIIIWNLNISNENVYNNTGKVLERRGYTFMDKVYSKLKGENNYG
jgi:hypothetical protein